MGIHMGSVTGWSTGIDQRDTNSRSVVSQFGIGCAALLGICMLLGIVGTIVGNGTPFSSANNFSQPGSISNVSSSGYRVEIMSQSDELGRSMTRFSILSENPQLFSDTWRQDVATELAIWRSTYRDAAALSAPDEFAAFHTSYLAALAEFDAAADKVERGMDTMDPDLMDAASDDIVQGTTLIDDALAAIPN